MKKLTQTWGPALRHMVLIAVASGLVLSGCGDDPVEKDPEAEKQKKERAVARKRAMAKEAAKKAANTKQLVQVPTANWKFMERYFDEHLQGSALASKNITAPNSDTFIKRPELKEEEVPPDQVEVVAPPVEPKVIHGLEAYELKSYKLIMIVSGTTVNQAMVVDEKGKQYLVERGTRIGNKGARVQAITQYTVFIQEPDADKPFKLDIEPPFIGLESSPDQEAGESSVVPKTDLESLLRGVPPAGQPVRP